jgi:undecaprenyl-diphosphatase
MKKQDSHHWETQLLLFVIIMILMGICHRIDAQNVDIHILRQINTPHELMLDGTFRGVSNSAYFVVVAVPLSLFIYGQINNNGEMTDNGCALIISSVATLVFTTTVKDLIRRQRPFVLYPYILNKSRVYNLDYSFPSGHTASAFNTATFISLSYPRWYIIAPSFVYAGAVGYSRMYLGVHYSTDVFAGAALGAGTAWLTYYINKKLNKRQNVSCSK